MSDTEFLITKSTVCPACNGVGYGCGTNCDGSPVNPLCANGRKLEQIDITDFLECIIDVLIGNRDDDAEHNLYWEWGKING